MQIHVNYAIYTTIKVPRHKKKSPRSRPKHDELPRYRLRGTTHTAAVFSPTPIPVLLSLLPQWCSSRLEMPSSVGFRGTDGQTHFCNRRLCPEQPAIPVSSASVHNVEQIRLRSVRGKQEVNTRYVGGERGALLMIIPIPLLIAAGASSSEQRPLPY
jgi:hypothetical protein